MSTKHHHYVATSGPAPGAIAPLDPQRQARLATIGQLAASIAHEVDQPLAAIALHAHAALRCIERAQAPAQAHAALRAVLEASAQASDIVRSMRTLAGQAQVTRVRCCLDRILEDVLACHAAAFAREGIGCRVCLPPGVLELQASPVQLRQLLRNLVANAIDALREVDDRPRLLRITASAYGDALAITVRDNGAGLSEEQAPHVFEPLFTTKPDGMGLGLAICRAIVDAHGGRIWAGPSPRGPGCVVGFSLPRQPAAAAVQEQEAQIG